jgi:hypothetical protein
MRLATPAGGFMNGNPTRRSRKRRIGASMTSCLTLITVAAALAGCGGSSDVMEIPEAARKSVLQKKVDVRPRAAKSSKSGPGSPSGR